MIDIDKSLEIAKDAALLAGKFLISVNNDAQKILGDDGSCLLYTSPSPRD